MNFKQKLKSFYIYLLVLIFFSQTIRKIRKTLWQLHIFAPQNGTMY